MIPHKNIIKDMGRILFWYPLRWVVQMSPNNLIDFIARQLGGVDYFLSKSDRIDKMAGNISSALGVTDQAARKIVRDNLTMNISNNLELMTYPRLTRDKVDGIAVFESRDRLDTELKKGKGVVLLTAHLGTKQLLQITLGVCGYPVNQIHYHMGREELSFIQKNVAQRQRKKIESKIPVRFIPADTFMRPVIQCLKDNQILIMAGDGIGLKDRMDSSYLPFDIFGKSMRFPVGPALVALKTGASLLPVFAVRQKKRHKIIFEPPLTVTDDINKATTAYVKRLEGYIRQYPAQWEYWEEFERGFLLEGDVS